MQIQSAIRPNSRNTLSRSGIAYQKWIAEWLGKSLHIACVSKKTSDDLAENLPETRRRDRRVIYNCLNSAHAPMSQRDASLELDPLGLTSEPFLLHIGGNQWYKNRRGTVEIFAELLRIGFPVKRLIMAGKPLATDISELVEKLGLKANVSNPTDVTDRQLNALYAAAEALLFPSLMEGFGWPILEALSCRCPVITANRPPMTEVGARHAIYIDPTDPPNAAKATAAAWPNRRKCLENCEAHLSRFSSERFADAYIRYYEDILLAK